MAKPLARDYGEYYQRYVNLVPEDELLQAFSNQAPVVLQFLNDIPADKRDYAYAPGKWTLKQMLQHLTDTERIFAYRALRFARKDITPLPGFEQDDYVQVADVSQRRWEDMIEEYQTVHAASEQLFRSFTAEELDRKGIASNMPLTVLSIGFIIVGHGLHHKRITEERYL
jgi:uncharacterized damage-inducible protein DinB